MEKAALFPVMWLRRTRLFPCLKKIKADYNRLDILVNIAGGDYENDASIDEIGYEKDEF